MTSRLVFLDTVGLLALWDRRDQWHADAEQAFGQLLAQKLDLLTTDLILAECANAAARRPYREAVASLRRNLDAAGCVIKASDEEWARAWVEYERLPAGGPGLVDLISFQVMRRFGIARAFTNDRHFQMSGFEILF